MTIIFLIVKYGDLKDLYSIKHNKVEYTIKLILN